jgi:hypothetical protein
MSTLITKKRKYSEQYFQTLNNKEKYIDLGNLNNKNYIFSNILLNTETYSNIICNSTKDYLESLLTSVIHFCLKIEEEMFIEELNAQIENINNENNKIKTEIQEYKSRINNKSLKMVINRSLSSIRKKNLESKKKTQKKNESILDKKIRLYKTNQRTIRELDELNIQLKSFEKINQRSLLYKPESVADIKGGLNDDDVNNIIWCLEYGVPDSLHDFGKSRNGIFPALNVSKNIPMSTLFLNKAEDFLKKSYLDHFKDSVKKDRLYIYYSEYPGNFEPIVKNDLLLGKICGDMENIFYYFNSELPSTKGWSEIKDDLYGKNTPSSLDSFFEQKDNYKYFILDACMSIQKEWEKIGQKPYRLNSLCNLWDPAGAGTFKFKKVLTDDIELTDNQNGLELIEEYSYNNYKIYDSRKNNSAGSKGAQKNDDSLYDYTYYDLLNKNCLNDIDITFKIRIGIENNNCKIFLLIFSSNQEPEMILIENGGFSVKILSFGLVFIENDFNDYKSIPEKMKKDYNNLKEVILTVKNRMLEKNIDNNEMKNKLFTLITRFKSSGDHGSALSTKFMNEELKLETLYLSGDQLAYVYSILIGNPTIFRFYNGSGSNDNDDEDEDKCKVEERIHFIGASFPDNDEVKNMNTKLNDLKTFFKNMAESISSPENNNSQKTDILQIGLTEYTTKLENIKSYLFDQEKYNQTDTYMNDILQKNSKELNEIIVELYYFIINIRINDNDLEDKNVLTEYKRKFKEWNELMKYIYFIKNYKKAREIIIKVFKKQIEDLNSLISIDITKLFNNSLEKEQQRRRSALLRISSNVSFSFNKIYTKIKERLNLLNFVNELKNTKSQMENIDNEYDAIMKIKHKYLSRISDISLSMKKNFFNNYYIIIEQSRSILDIYTQQIANDLEKLVERDNNTNPMIRYIIDIFFSTIEPVEAIPIEDEEILIEKVEKEIINKNTLSISNEGNGGVIKSQTKKVLNAFKEIPSNIKNTYTKMKKIPGKITNFISKTVKRTKISGGKNTTKKLK